mmetsp:Transcript_25510/g.73774  ORF Transcript_25510/g.73774 Transcript_25510/m.73774 type:complete len:313 (+) Transcript_25510:106-1044(+)
MSAGNDTNDGGDDRLRGGGAGRDPAGPPGQEDDVPMPEPNQDSTDDEILTDGDDEGDAGDDGDDGDETAMVDATGGADSFGGNGWGAGGTASTAAVSLGGMGVVGVAGIAAGGAVVLNGILNEEAPPPHFARAPGTRRRYNPDKYLPNGRLRPTAEAATERRDLGTSLITDVQALGSRSRRRATTYPYDGMSTEEAERLASGAGVNTNADTNADTNTDTNTETNTNADVGGSSADALGAAAVAAVNEGDEAAAPGQQPPRRRSRRHHSSSPTRWSVERYSGAVLEDLMAIMGLNEEEGPSRPMPPNPWGESQ